MIKSINDRFHWMYRQWEAKPEDPLYLETREWKEIPGLPGYRLASDGRVYSDKIKDIRKENTNGSYHKIQFCHKGKTKTVAVHRLVAKLYGDAPSDTKKTQANHKDGNKANNGIDNVEWLTPSENMQHAVDTGLNKCKRAIIQYDLQGNEIARYCSAADAGRKLGVIPSRITTVYRRKKKSSGKFVWRYDSEPLEDPISIKIRNYKKKVAQLDKNGNIIKIYDSILSAAKDNGSKQGYTINNACHVKIKTAHGYKWKFLEK